MSSVRIVEALQTKEVQTVCINELFERLKSAYDPSSRGGAVCYEYFDSDSMKMYVRPYFDWESVIPVPQNLREVLCDPLKHLETLGIMDQLHKAFGTLDINDWAIACDTRMYQRATRKSAELKISYHLVCIRYKIRMSVMKRLASKLHKTDKFIDTAVYRNGLNKWRIPFTKKCPEDIESLMRPLNHCSNSSEFRYHLISDVEDDMKEFDDGSSIVERRTTVPSGYVPASDQMDDVISQYTIVSKRFEEGGRIEFLNIKEYECINGPHRSNHNFLTVDRVLHRVYIHCHSEKCKGWSKLLYGTYRGTTDTSRLKFDIDKFHEFKQLCIDKDGNEKIDADATYALRKQYFDIFHSYM